MTRITGQSINTIEMNSWTKANQEQIEKHPAWRGSLSAMQTESLLERRDVFTYLLRGGEEKNAYYISFVKRDGMIKHQRFTLEYDRKGWYYKNGMNTSGTPTEMIAETLPELIPQMMHCSTEDCKIVDSH